MTHTDEDVFGPDSMLRHLVNDVRWGLAVTRATVLEAAHPQIGAALLENSTFVTHPWRRLRNTLVSMNRVLDLDPRVRDREVARINRMHARISGTDPQGRPYDGMDVEARAWVVATLFESTVTMYRLSGESLDGPALEQLYGEFGAFLRLLEGEDHRLPATVQEFWPYYDHMIDHRLQSTEAVRVILYRLFANVPAPPLLRDHPAVWATGRAVAGPAAAAITIAALPESFCRRIALPDLPAVRTLTRGTYLAAGLAAHLLPTGWADVNALMSLLDPGHTGGAGPWETVRRKASQAAAMVRLITPARDDVHQAAYAADQFFAEVLDQTGDGHLAWPDLAAMAREIATRLDLDAPDEERLYSAYAAWWRELQSNLDTDGDGRVTRQEYAASAVALPSSGLIRVADVLFDVTDSDDDQLIDAQEYQKLFRAAFHRDLTGDADRYSRGAFVRQFLSFMSGQQHSVAYDTLLS
ncbi:oxygenase MpaB family protein [Nonomuraea longicatena]|uniref:ER-bound oxygenase mpaB/mpaB'/Rubber oxygenase catalytic domain-containing protein n=1 Tax=Nonomuraea longicatena TaxID=83682 RepID=A0ABP4AHE4_9ACTN